MTIPRPGPSGNGVRPRTPAGPARWASNPFWLSCAAAVLLVLVGFSFVGIAWRGVARTAYVALQLPWIISGGLGGLSLVAAGVTVFAVQMSRRDAARERRDLDRLVQLASDLVAALGDQDEQ